MEKTTLTTAATCQLAALEKDRSRFSNHVRELASAGSTNPIFEAAKKYPAEYNTWRAEQESTCFRTRQ